MDFSGLVLFQIWMLIIKLLHQFYANEADPNSEMISAIFILLYITWQLHM